MKRDRFGGYQPEPEDDLAATFSEHTGGGAEGLGFNSSEISHEEHLGGWTAEVTNAEGDSLTAVGFPTRESLVEWLTSQGAQDQDR